MSLSLPYVIEKTQTLALYAAAGAVAGAIELTVLHLIITRTEIWYVYASALSAATSCIIGFMLRKIYVFRDREWKTLPKQFAAYLGILILIILISTTTMSFLVEHFKAPYLLAQAIAGITTGLIGFVLNKQFTFHSSGRGVGAVFEKLKSFF